ncbi:MAG: FCD domain-containing protein, partial [Pseudomonadota bacterium]
IERRILTGEYKSGERLNENALAQELGISRGPIREACRSLVESRLLTVVINRGFFVRTVSAKEAADVYDVRAALMRVAGETLARRITEPQIHTLQELVARMDEAIGRDDRQNYLTLNVEFHDRIVDYAENDRLRAICEGLAKELRLYRHRSLVSGTGLHESHREHREIMDALAARDPERSATALEQHIHAGKHRFLNVTDVADEDDGEPQ